jgi:long-chain acyl-CoA synthetase
MLSILPIVQRPRRRDIGGKQIGGDTMTAEVIFGGRRWSGEEIDRTARQVAGGLTQLAIVEGDVAAVMLCNAPAFLQVIQGCRIAGCFYCPVNWP